MPNEPTTVDTEPILNPDPVETYDDVKYYSQLDKDTAGNKDIMDRVKGYKSVSELAKGYADLSKRMDGALVVPTKDSSVDEVKAYFRALGVPEKAEDYNLSDGDYSPETIKALKENFQKEVLYRNGITKHQGEKVWNACLKMLQSERDMNIANYEKAKASFEERHSNLLREQYPVEADRKAAMNEDMSLAAEFFSESGLGQFFKQTGLVYNPEVMHKLAQYHKATRASGVMGKGGESRRSEGVFSQGKEFMEAYGR